MLCWNCWNYLTLVNSWEASKIQATSKTSFRSFTNPSSPLIDSEAAHSLHQIFPKPALGVPWITTQDVKLAAISSNFHLDFRLISLHEFLCGSLLTSSQRSIIMPLHQVTHTNLLWLINRIKSLSKMTRGNLPHHCSDQWQHLTHLQIPESQLWQSSIKILLRHLQKLFLNKPLLL